mgnify:CR=1 FL=1
MRNWTFVRVALVALLLVVCQVTRTLAGTTGGISGYALDANGNPVAGVSVTANSPSQTVTRTTDAKGFYSILDLSPDTYVVTATKDGYDTATVRGITVQADQNTTVAIALKKTIKELGRIVTTAQASVVNKSVTGDLYSVNAAAISNYQGAVGGSESLYSQNAIVGSMPGVVHQIGIGGGYQQGQGTISLRGGAFDQVGFELEGVPLNRGFDFYNGTPFVNNGLASLEVYTGGAPADSGRAMSGYINEVIQRGSYPGFSHLNFTFGSPSFDNTLQYDVSAGTPDRKFTAFVSTLAMYATFNYGDRSNGDNYGFTIPANDPGCPDFNFIQTTGFGGGTPLNCAVPNKVNAPISIGAWLPQGSPINPSAKVWDTIANLHYAIDHHGLSDDLQFLYNVGATNNPYAYSGASIDPAIVLTGEVPTFLSPSNQLIWPYGRLYTGSAGTPYDATKLATLFWPDSNNSNGPLPANYVDNQWTQHSIEKLAYTRALNDHSFLRVFGYALYSAWLLDQASNGILGGEFYQLHDNATGVTVNYQNQLNAQNLLRLDADYSKDLTLRYNYVPWLPFNQMGHPGQNFANFGAQGMISANPPNEFVWAYCNGTVLGVPFDNIPCQPNPPPFVTENTEHISVPYAYWSSATPSSSDFVIADQFKPTDKLLFDLGVRFDNFRFALMPLQITGPNGLAEQSQSQDGQCLFGYAYTAAEPCFNWLATAAAAWKNPAIAAGKANWQDVTGSLNFNEFSPRLGVTFTPNVSDVFRFSVGRFVQPPDSAFEEYRGAPQFGPYATVAVLNRSYNAQGIAPSFLGVHNVQPEDSTNFDISWEHNLGSGWSFKATPYYRTTRGQILNLPVTISSPTFVTGYNFGDARISGIELLLSKDRLNPDLGWNFTVAATNTNSKVRFTKVNGVSYIDVVNNAITAYNAANGTSFALEDPNGYYSPGFSLAPTLSTPSWDVRWVLNLNADYRWMGWDFVPTLNYQSGNPYGDPFEYPDPSGNTTFGPDPYTKQFDALGSLKGPSFWTGNLAISRDLSSNTKITALFTGIYNSVHNQGYPWEYPTSRHVIAYSGNSFYSPYVGPVGAVSPAYIGDDYYGYAPNSLLPTPEFTVTISQKLW